MDSTPAPSGSERRGSARAAKGGSAGSTSVRDQQPRPQTSRRIASSSASPAARAITSAAPCPADSAPPAAVPVAPPRPKSSRRGPAALPPEPAAPAADGTRRSPRPTRPLSRRSGDPVAEAQPHVRPLTSRSLRGSGTRVVPPVPPATPGIQVASAGSGVARPASSRRLPAAQPGGSGRESVAIAGDSTAVEAMPTRRELDVSNLYRSQRAAAGRK